MNQKMGTILAVVLAACGGTAPRHASASATSSHSASPAAPASPVRTYPEQAADTALCNTYNTDIQNGDTYDIGQALQQALGTVSPKLASDIQVLVNTNGTLQQDMKNQIAVNQDCALAETGVQP